ncbi:MAG: hypothetical protein WBD47_04580 [Phormidesmis sp.]
MNRLPRRMLHIPPPVRGRAAAQRPRQTPRAVVYPPRPAGRTTIVKVVEKPICDDLHPDWITFYQRSPGTFKILSRPWHWLLLLAILMSLSVMLGKAL